MNDKEVAQYLGVAPQTLRNWRYEQRGPAYHKLGGKQPCRVVYMKADLDAFLESRKVEPKRV